MILAHERFLIGLAGGLITPDQDAKLQTLKQWLAKPDILGKKQIIFTQYANTAQYLYNQITDDSDREDIEVIHSNSGKDKGRLVQRFAPKANDNYQLKRSNRC